MTAYNPASRLVCSRSLRLAATTALALNTASIAHADEAAVRSHPVVKFLQERVIGHALQSATSATINGGLNSYDFSMTSRFANLYVSDTGVRFNELNDIKNTYFQVIEGQRVLPGQNWDRLMHFNWELALRASDASSLYGYYESAANTVATELSAGRKVQLRMDGDRLVVKGELISPSDCQVGAEKVLCDSVVREEYSVENGKLVQRSHAESYRLDPETLQRGALINSSDTESREP